MKKIFSVCFITIFIFMSCDNGQDKTIPLHSILEASYELNNKTLNVYKSKYYEIRGDFGVSKVPKLNELDTKFELLLSKIDISIANKKYDLEKINATANEILKELPSLVDNRKDYLLPEFKKTENSSKQLQLKYIKNRLVIAMAYAFEYNNHFFTSPASFCDVKKLNIDAIIETKNKDGIKLTLTSKYGQAKKEERELLINNILFNGVEKKIKYYVVDNYSFADVALDSLQKGNYQMNGVLRINEGDMEKYIPFEREFKIE